MADMTDNQKADALNEALLMGKIQNKHIVRHYRSFETENKLNILMEFCEQGDLSGFLKKR